MVGQLLPRAKKWPVKRSANPDVNMVGTIQEMRANHESTAGRQCSGQFANRVREEQVRRGEVHAREYGTVDGKRAGDGTEGVQLVHEHRVERGDILRAGEKGDSTCNNASNNRSGDSADPIKQDVPADRDKMLNRVHPDNERQFFPDRHDNNVQDNGYIVYGVFLLTGLLSIVP